MTKTWKKIKYLSIILILIVIGLIKVNNLKIIASSNPTIHFIFNQKSYEVGDTIKLTLNLADYTLVNEVRLTIKYCNDVMSVQKVNDAIWQLNSNAIFKDVLINEIVDINILRLHIANQNAGYNYKNNICEVNFIATRKISNIYDYFVFNDIEENEFGVNIYLFNIYDKLIAYEKVYTEKIKVEWQADSYQIEVYNDLPNFLDDIKILNREKNEYELIYEDDLNNETLGTQVINIAIFDKTNADKILLSRILYVVDKTAPQISGETEISLNSSDIDNSDFLSYIRISDNYDPNPSVVMQYYQSNGEKFANVNLFKSYLKSNTNGYIEYVAIDNSNNTSIVWRIDVKVIDTTPPILEEINDLEILDTDLDEFDIETLFIFSDDYDRNPKLICDFYDLNKNTISDYRQYLKTGQSIIVQYFARDASGNESEHRQFQITVKDTIAPTITGVNNLTINDFEIDSFNFQLGIEISDNFDLEPELIIYYYQVLEYQNNQPSSVLSLTREEFIYALKRGLPCYIEYSAKDNGGNISNKVYQYLTILDTTPPAITIKNIKDGNKYIKIDKIEYEVIDNFDHEPQVEIYLNGIVYNGDVINQPGEYLIVIKAKDQSNNEIEEQVYFTIIKNNVIGCGDDFGCYLENYMEVVIIVACLLSFVIVIVTIRIALRIKRRKR